MIAVMADRLGEEVRVSPSVSEFGLWMTSEQRRIYLLCRRMLQDADEADSATQDVFLKAFQALRRESKGPYDLETPEKWVTRIAVNTCLDRLRSKAWKVWHRRPAPKDEEVILTMMPGAGPDAERQLLSKQIHVKLESALGRLSARQRAAFLLRHYEGLAIEEIASALKLDSGTVKAHLFRATAKLREELRELYFGAGTR
jgi:RNA polymerase sigma-70 factor (ECF subfamily)